MAFDSSGLEVLTAAQVISLLGKLDTLHTDLGAGAATIAKAEDVASANADVGVPAMAIRKATPANTSGTDGDYEMLQISAGRLWVDASGKTLTVDGSGVTQPISNTSLTAFGTGKYITVAASTGPTTLQSSTGATGDYISGVLVIPASTSPGAITLTDNSTAITIFAGGTSSVSNLVPFFIPLGAVSASGAWKLTTGASVSCIGIGKFS
jgi:hypothetical protein